MMAPENLQKLYKSTKLLGPSGTYFVHTLSAFVTSIWYGIQQLVRAEALNGVATCL